MSNKKQFGFFLYNEDVSAFEEMVKSSGLDKSEFCRRAIFSERIVIIKGLEDIPKMLQALYSSSGNENIDFAITELEKKLQCITVELSLLNENGGE